MFIRASILAIALSGTAVVATAALNSDIEDLDPAQTATAIPAEELTFTGFPVDALLGAPLLDDSRANAGFVSELLISAEGQVTGAVLSVDHPMPFATHEVAVPIQELAVIEVPDQGYRMLVDSPAAALRDMPAFDPASVMES